MCHLAKLGVPKTRHVKPQTVHRLDGLRRGCRHTDLVEELSRPLVERASFELEAKRFASTQGYSVDWDSVTRLDDVSLIDGVSQIAPFDPASKQALLEANTLNERCELLVQLMQFFARRDGDDDRVTLQ
jgi:Lon protease-like protein